MLNFFLLFEIKIGINSKILQKYIEKIKVNLSFNKKI